MVRRPPFRVLLGGLLLTAVVFVLLLPLFLSLLRSARATALQCAKGERTGRLCLVLRPLASLNLWSTSTPVLSISQERLPVAQKSLTQRHTPNPRLGSFSPTPLEIRSLVVTPDSRLVLCLGSDGSVQVWSLPDLEKVATFPHTPITALATSSKWLVTHWIEFSLTTRMFPLRSSGSEVTKESMGIFSVWSLPEIRLVSQYRAPVSLRSMAVSPNGEFLFFAPLTSVIFPDNPIAISVVRLRDGEPVTSLQGHKGTVLSLSVSPNGRLLASGGGDAGVLGNGFTLTGTVEDRTVRLWAVGAWRETAVLTGHTGEILALAFSPDGGLLASAGKDATIRLWRVPTGEPVGVLSGHTAPVRAVAFIPDGRLLVSAGGDRTVRIWRILSGETAAVLTVPQAPTAVAVSPDGRFLLAGTESGALHLWPLE